MIVQHGDEGSLTYVTLRKCEERSPELKVLRDGGTSVWRAVCVRV